MVLKRLFGKKEKTADAEVHGPENKQTWESAAEQESPEPEREADSLGLFQRLRAGLSKTRQGFVDKVESLVSGRAVDEDLFEDLEDLLIQADVGVDTTMKLMDGLRERVRSEKITEGSALKTALADEVARLLAVDDTTLKISEHRPSVIMVVGVNGSGKTTTIGKLAYRLKQEGAKVILGAGDTFRAAAIDQLEAWAERVGVEIVSHSTGSDPAAVAYDALAAAKARNADVLILDTAGRLQTKTNLMKELGKVHRVLERELDHSIDEILLVLDATTGQNALSQAKIFSDSVPVTGIALTKLDGTAKGGIVLAVTQEVKVPVKLIGVGEQYHDLQDFDAVEFAEALFG